MSRVGGDLRYAVDVEKRDRRKLGNVLESEIGDEDAVGKNELRQRRQTMGDVLEGDIVDFTAPS